MKKKKEQMIEIHCKKKKSRKKNQANNGYRNVCLGQHNVDKSKTCL